MAKQSLPSVDDYKGPTVSNPAELPTPPPSESRIEGYVSRRVDIKISREAAIKLLNKTRKLQDAGAMTADGRFVTNKTQAIQWIIENEVNV